MSLFESLSGIRISLTVKLFAALIRAGRDDVSALDLSSKGDSPSPGRIEE